MIDLAGLNDQQKQAVMHGKGPCLVLAAAGSGKTKVVTIRAARLIDEGVGPERVLLATFTKKAGEEMKKRIGVLIGEERAKAMWIGTFHSHCLRMLRLSYHELNKPAFEVLPPEKAIRVARDILAPHDSKHPYGMDWQTDPKGTLSTISRAKADLVDVKKAKDYFAEQEVANGNTDRLVDFWFRYEAVKQEWRSEPGKPMRTSLLDFDDFLLRTHQMFRVDVRMLARWQTMWDYILEDEVQDTMIAQHEIVRLLAAQHRNYFCVGDIQQSVYGFRGSNPQHTVMSFERDYPEGMIIKLPTNYRSQSEIVDLGTRLIRHNEVGASYRLEPTAHRKPEADPELMVACDEDDEAEQIAEWIVRSQADGRAYRNIAILYRINAQSRAFEDAMIRHRIPYVVWGSCGFYDRREIKDVLAFVQLAHDPKYEAANEALKRVVNIPTIWFRLQGERKYTHFLGNAFLRDVETLAERRGLLMWDALDRGDWKRYQWDAIEDLREFVREVARAGPSPQAMIEKARSVGYDDYLMREQGGDEGENEGTRFENLDELVCSVNQFDNAGALLDYVERQHSQAKTLAKDRDSVQLLTMHRSKGLEWPVVFVAGVSMRLLPHWRSVKYYDPETKLHIIPESIEEERRLCYVGVTRAMDELYVCALKQYHYKPLPVSPFLTEMGFEIPAELVAGEVESGEAEETQETLKL